MTLKDEIPEIIESCKHLLKEDGPYQLAEME